jgi:hypothetical protein
MARIPRRRPPRGLTPLQVEVGRIFFALPASEGFLVGGDAALAAHRLIDRPTRDLRLLLVEGAGAEAQAGWTPGAAAVQPALAALHAEARDRGWVTQDLPSDPEDGGAALLLEGMGHRLIATLLPGPQPAYPATLTVLGPTMAPEELAGRLVAALSERADPDDLVDLLALARRFATDRLLVLAAEADPGFDPTVLARSLAAGSDPADGADP